MASKDEIERRLEKAAEDLKRELIATPGLRLNKKTGSKESDTDGYFVTIATWADRPSVQLWLDKSTGPYRFWFGFASPSKQKITDLISQLPDELAPPTKPYTLSDWKGPENKRAFKKVEESKLTRPFWESYDADRGFYFGRYDWGGHGRKDPSQLDSFGAASFIRDIVNAVVGEDDELCAFEGEAKRRFVLHRRREAKLRRQKKAEARRLTGRLICEVPNCGFDFSERYGKLGVDYAQVHHKTPLAEAVGKGLRVTLSDLAIVCANCHAMIHRGGECRPLDGLIANPQPR